uniref:Uncharacterized protein n=1 Tax=Craspedostauros australis TaxID=1486917 RepID=A0A7R9ZM17_9STRA|mmetsp:Transcript_15903/g.43954  ORF Transcript_15903/g.43954 Transcript_15903/m.43954 type:complete len:290 (+) Transcript_15903:114-983(+)
MNQHTHKSQLQDFGTVSCTIATTSPAILASPQENRPGLVDEDMPSSDAQSTTSTSTKMDNLKSALHLNATGVRHLRNKQDQQALRCLTESLSLLKRNLSQSMGQGQDVMIAKLMSNPSQRLIDADFIPLEGLIDQDCFVYSDTVMFSTPNNFEDVQHLLHVYIAGIILNISLAYHRRAAVGSMPYLQKAMKMYEMVISLCSNEADEQGLALLFRLAATNNISQIRYTMFGCCSSQGEADLQSPATFEHLGSLWNLVEMSFLQGNIPLHVFDGLVFNILLSRYPSMAAAA